MVDKILMSDTFKDMRRHGREPKTRSGLGRCAATGKRMFHSQEEALAAADRRLQDPHCNAASFRAYPCNQCGRWHLTSQPLR